MAGIPARCWFAVCERCELQLPCYGSRVDGCVYKCNKQSVYLTGIQNFNRNMNVSNQLVKILSISAHQFVKIRHKTEINDHGWVVQHRFFYFLNVFILVYLFLTYAFSDSPAKTYFLKRQWVCLKTCNYHILNAFCLFNY